MDIFGGFMNDEKSFEEVLGFSVPMAFSFQGLWGPSPPSSKPMESWLGDSMTDLDVNPSTMVMFEKICDSPTTARPKVCPSPSSFQANSPPWLEDLMTDVDVNSTIMSEELSPSLAVHQAQLDPSPAAVRTKGAPLPSAVKETKFPSPAAVPKNKKSELQCSLPEAPKKSTVKPLVQKSVQRKRGKRASLKMLSPPPRKRCVKRPRAEGMGFLPHSTRTEAAGGPIFSKTITSYDYNRGGILIPRDPARKYVPRGGVTLEDKEDGSQYRTEKKIWRNKSPIHVFEHMRAYMKHYNLRPGDQLQFQRSRAGHLIIERLYATRCQNEWSVKKSTRRVKKIY